MRINHLALGEIGEELAAAYLKKHGHAIVARRIRYRAGELDIVARDGAEWVFVEVKTRSMSRMGMAHESMTKRKAGRMGKAVREYVQEHGLWNEPMRFDLIAIDVAADGTHELHHYRGGVELE